MVKNKISNNFETALINGKMVRVLSPYVLCMVKMKLKKCISCNGIGMVDNDVNGINFPEECQNCKGSGKV